MAKRGLILERDSILRQQKLKAIFAGDQDTSATGSLDLNLNQSYPLIEPTTVLAQQVSPRKNGSSLALLKYSSAKKLSHSSVTHRNPGTVALKRPLAPTNQYLTDLDLLDDKSQEAIRQVVTKHTPLLKFLFDRYQNSASR